MHLPSDKEMQEAITLLEDPRYEVPTIVGENQQIVPERVAKMLRCLLTTIRDGDLIPTEHSAGVCCEHHALARTVGAPAAPEGVNPGQGYLGPDGKWVQ